MNCDEYVPYIQPVKKPSLSFSIWYNFKCICDTIRHNYSMWKYKQIKKETIKKVESANIVGMELEEARKTLPKVILRDYGTDNTQSGCCARCNVYVDEHNIITEIANFG